MHRLLQRLAQTGLVRASTEGHQKYYQANADAPVFEQLLGLIRKPVGLAGPLAAEMRSAGQFRCPGPRSAASRRAR